MHAPAGATAIVQKPTMGSLIVGYLVKVQCRTRAAVFLQPAGLLMLTCRSCFFKFSLCRSRTARLFTKVVRFPRHRILSSAFMCFMAPTVEQK